MSEPGVDAERIDWDKDGGLLPAIVQDADSGAVLMLGYMNREALQRHARTRPRGVLQPHASSGCGRRARPPATPRAGRRIRPTATPTRCWCGARPRARPATGRSRPASATEPLTRAEPLAFLAQLEDVIADAHREAPGGQLHRPAVRARACGAWPRRSARKASKSRSPGPARRIRELIGESADLLFHLLLLLRSRAIPLAAVVDELRQRHAARAAAGTR